MTGKGHSGNLVALTDNGQVRAIAQKNRLQHGCALVTSSCELGLRLLIEK
jgi:hypothetical protein